MFSSKSRPVTKPQRGRKARVGDRVGLQWGGQVILAFVVEDRGPLGAQGQQVVRLMAPDKHLPEDPLEIEVPVDWLLPAPVH